MSLETGLGLQCFCGNEAAGPKEETSLQTSQMLQLGAYPQATENVCLYCPLSKRDDPLYHTDPM